MVVYSHNVLYCASCGRGGQVAARIPLLHRTSPERDALIHRSIDLPQGEDPQECGGCHHPGQEEIPGAAHGAAPCLSG